MLSHAHRARSSAHLPPTRQGARVAGTAQAAARAEAEGMRADSAMADSAGGQRGRRGHVVEGSPLTRRLDKRGMPPHPLGKGYAVWGVSGPFAVPASSPSDDCTGAGERGLARVDCPADAPEPPAAHHACASTAHTAPRAGRPWPYPYWASRGASSCCLAAPDHRREGERTRSAGAGEDKGPGARGHRMRRLASGPPGPPRRTHRPPHCAARSSSCPGWWGSHC